MPFYFKLENSSLLINLDLILLYLTIQSIFIERHKLILLGFLIGFLIDIDIEQKLIGLNSFIIPIGCYFLGFIRIHKNNWNFNIKIFYLLSIYCIMFFNKFLFYGYGFNFYDFLSIIINSSFIIIILLSINRFYYKGKLI